MKSRYCKTRMNVQGDIISNLPDDLIHKILSLVGIKLAVQTSALSSRWRYLWTSLPCLNFSSEDFNSLDKFSKFVTHVLSCRNNQIEVSSAKLSFYGKPSQAFVNRILDYAFSHNVKQLTVSCLLDRGEPQSLSLFSSHSLEHLTIAGHWNVSSVILTSTWEFTSLTTLHIEYIILNDEVTAKDTGIFSKCVNLKKLVLKGCSMTGSNGTVDICHPGLTSLTLDNGYFFKNVINVVAPQLKDLSVIMCKRLHRISAPELVSLRFEGWEHHSLQLYSDGLCSLENVDLRIIKERFNDKPNKYNAHTIFDLLQQLHSVKYLTLNLEIFELLSPLTELISYQPSPFVNLKSLKVYPHNFSVGVLETIPAEVKRFLLDGSPSATFTEVSCKEMRELENAESALKCMARLREMLEHEKANIETNIVMSPMECHKPNMHEQDKMQIDKWEMRKQIDSCLKDLSSQIKHGKAKISDIISKLCHIKELLTELPASKGPHIKTYFCKLCTEADVVMNAIRNSMKIQSDEKQSRLSIYFHELAIGAKLSV